MYGQPGQPPVGYVPPGQAFGVPSNPAQHQFSEIDRAVFVGLADNIQFVSTAGIVLGALGTLGGLAGLATQGARGLSTLAGSIGFLAQGITLRAAQSHFRVVAQGSGDDVPSTMQGVSSLTPYYVALLVTTAAQLLATLIGMVA